MRLRIEPSRSLLSLGLALAIGCDGDPPSPTEPTPAGDAQAPPPSAADEGEADPPPADDGAAPPDGADEPTPAEPAAAVMAPPPDPAALTMHALAAYEIVTLYAEPNLESTKLGYLRMGQRTMVTAKLDDQGEGCTKGWYQLPSGAYACASKGLTVDADKEPYMHQPPPRPRQDEPMPYDYAVVARDGTEMWWRPPDALERELAAEKYAMQQEKLAAEAAAAAGEPPPPPKPKPASAQAPVDGGEDGGAEPPALPGVDDPVAEPPAPLTPEEIAERKRKEEEARQRAEEEAALRREKMAKLPLHPETPYLEKGFIITAALKIKDKGRTWWRTSRGGYLDANKVFKRGEPKIVALGHELPEDTGFPFGFVRDDKTPVFTMNAEGKLQRTRSAMYRDFVDGVEQLEIDGKEYLRTAEDEYLRTKDLRLAEPRTRPEGVGPDEHWIDVKLEDQLLVAYEGERPVFTTLVSTGRKGTEEEPFDTPTGTFRIQTKHISSTMDGNTASDGAYSIQDVPWAMFFHGNYALHGAFWHAGFGGRRSHGCINLAVGDARWLFWWVGPTLPEGWHGAAAHADSPGSVVVVR
ncbi:MAG: L,D-transpeptidase family protein [Myxococcales bacterium]|nr:L,D-transpeptidase family protein [Myxococcales bacterium]